MHEHWLFISNVAAHLVASMSGVASFVFAIIEHARNKKIETWAFCIVGTLCLIIGFDQAWQDEHNNVKVLIGEKSALVQERDFWKEQSYAKDAMLQSRDQLLAQNYTALIGEQTTANKSQTSLAQLSGKILNLDKPVKQKFTIGKNGWEPPTKQWSHIGQYIVMSNLPIRANISVKCDIPFTIIDASIVDGGPHFPNSIVQFDAYSWRINIPSPLITAETPLIITIGFEPDQLGKGKCGIDPE
jgi:hypothetical protein